MAVQSGYFIVASGLRMRREKIRAVKLGRQWA